MVDIINHPGFVHSENSLAQMVGRHENIVNLLGVCSQPLGQPLLVVLEFAQLGNLREFVQVLSCLVDTLTRFIFVQKRRLPGELCFKQMLVNITQVLLGIQFGELHSLLSGCAWDGVSCK